MTEACKYDILTVLVSIPVTKTTQLHTVKVKFVLALQYLCIAKLLKQSKYQLSSLIIYIAMYNYIITLSFLHARVLVVIQNISSFIISHIRIYNNILHSITMQHYILQTTPIVILKIGTPYFNSQIQPSLQVPNKIVQQEQYSI